jgi:AcrR family transcriptional regulator
MTKMVAMTQTSPPSRGDQTRDALILAALDLFGRSGYDATSTRAIAQAAGVNQALIGYHFGCKRGLYLAVFEHIVSRMRTQMLPVAEQVRLEFNDASGNPAQRRDFALRQLLNIFDAYTDMIGDGAAAGWVRLILREQQDPTEAFQLLYDNVFTHMLSPLLSQFVALATGLEQNSEACRIRTLMMLGQVLVFFVARGTTSRYLGWDTYGPDNITAIKQQLQLVLETQFPEEEVSS